MDDTRVREAASPGRDAGLGLARSAMARYAPAEARWHYEHGLFLGAARAAGLAWGDAELVREADSRMAALVREDGSIVGYNRGEYNLDQINPGKYLFELLESTRDTRYEKALAALAAQLAEQPRTRSGGYWHKLIYPDQVWLDGLYMAQPFRARLAVIEGRPADFDDIAAQLALIARKARDPGTGLLRHAWDEGGTQLWADPETGRSPNAWGRAMGWYAMALVDVLEWMPGDGEAASRVSGLLASTAESLARCQDAQTGLWHQVLDSGGREGNYLEASVSAMLAYAFAKGARLGALPADPWAAVADRACLGCARRFLRREPDGLHLDGTCAVAGLGGSPYRDGSFGYYVREPVRADDFKGVGPFILANIEYSLARESAR